MAAALVLLGGLCWWFLLAGGGVPGSSAMSGMTAMPPPPLIALVAMWWLMMVAMMIPSAVPAVLLYDRVRQQRHSGSVARTSTFVLGYLLAWLAFSLIAAVVHHIAAGPDMRWRTDAAGAFTLIAAGLYQLSPWKAACLRQCQSPARLLSTHWRPGAAGAVRLGTIHGAYCVGCCWLLMALLFVGGVMNFVWVVGLTILVAAEKLLPPRRWTSPLVAAVLLAWGAYLLLR